VIVHTLGHSTRSLDDFMALLDAHGIAGIADVRRFPGSRRHPHFAGEALATSLAAGGRRYDWLPALGGRRPVQPASPHVGWREPGFRGYADHMETDEFRGGLDELLVRAAERPTAVLCAEAVPWRCHRQLLADALLVRGVEVVHVLDVASTRPHRLTAFARIEGDRLVYDGGQLALGRSDRP
jgi:uncharacterized protein (DUF488 family)